MKSRSRTKARIDRAADFLNTNEVEVLCVQHEYGIYGGDCGEHVVEMLREVKMPVVTTLHTILTDPSPTQRRVLNEIAQLFRPPRDHDPERGSSCSRTFTICPRKRSTSSRTASPMSRSWTQTITRTSSASKARRCYSLLGLLSPGKGIEDVIAALPAVLAKHPDVVYVVLGATHPHVLKHEGEAYRNRLKEMARSLGVENAVRFFNQFVSLDDLKEFIGAADIYVTPYLNAAQITSGTLAYSFGAGKAVISTPYWHAEELLADDRGALVPFSDPAAICRRRGRDAHQRNAPPRDAQKRVSCSAGA